jgi:metal-sulfur cluster biosynthetic enzyme
MSEDVQSTTATLTNPTCASAAVMTQDVPRLP